MSWTIENMPKPGDRAIIKGHRGFWNVTHVEGPIVTLQHAEIPNVRTVQHVSGLEPLTD